MAKDSPEHIYQILRQAGFSAEGAVTMTAIAGAESGYDTGVLGDTKLVDATWGPSVGLFQIRTLKGKTGSGDVRDISALAGDELAQAKAAYAISKGGTDFTPWSVFNSGAYRKFLDAVRGAVGKLGDAATGAASKLTGGLVDQAAGAVRNLAVSGLFLLGGAALIIGGLALTSRPAAQRVDAVAARVGKAVILKR